MSKKNGWQSWSDLTTEQRIGRIERTRELFAECPVETLNLRPSADVLARQRKKLVAKFLRYAREKRAAVVEVPAVTVTPRRLRPAA